MLINKLLVLKFLPDLLLHFFLEAVNCRFCSHVFIPNKNEELETDENHCIIKLTPKK